MPTEYHNGHSMRIKILSHPIFYLDAPTEEGYLNCYQKVKFIKIYLTLFVCFLHNAKTDVYEEKLVRELLKWEDSNYTGGDGVLTGCDEKQEWMLKWWWNHYSQNNSLPVTFFDFGMTKSARLWCEKKGCVISVILPKNIVAPKEKIEKKQRETWEAVYSGNIWMARLGWFSKPFALLKSPYDRSCWIDLDCQIMQPLNELIAASDLASGVAIVREVERSVLFCKKFGIYLDGEISYNTGVISFKRGSPILLKWAENTLYRTKEFLGDQDVFNRTIFEEKYPLHELPSRFNARPLDGIFPETTILHFTCEPGKNYIFSKI